MTIYLLTYLANQYLYCLRVVIIGIYGEKADIFIVDLKLHLWKNTCDFNIEYSITHQLIFMSQVCNLQSVKPFKKVKKWFDPTFRND